MSTHGDDAQRELERRALRNVRGLIDKLEHSDEADERAQKRLLAAIIIGALVVAIGIGLAIFLSGDRKPPVTIDPSKLPPVRAGPPK